jgi:hypothetical protein
MLLLLEGGPHVRRHPSRHLAHGRQEGKPSVFLHDGLVGDPLDLPVEKGLGELPAGCQVEVREQDLPLPQAFVLGLDGLLYLEDEVGLIPQLVHRGRDVRPGPFVSILVQGRPVAGSRLHEHPVARSGELSRALGRERHAIFVVLELARNPDDHWTSRLLGFPRLRVPRRRLRFTHRRLRSTLGTVPRRLPSEGTRQWT